MTTGIFDTGHFTQDLAAKVVCWHDHTTYA